MRDVRVELISADQRNWFIECSRCGPAGTFTGGWEEAVAWAAEHREEHLAKRRS